MRRLQSHYKEALDGASRDLKHWRSVLPFHIRTSHAPGTAVIFISDSCQGDDIVDYFQPM
jgi:hypothetical protein